MILPESVKEAISEIIKLGGDKLREIGIGRDCMDENGNIAYRPHIVALYDSFYDVPEAINEYMGDYYWRHHDEADAPDMSVDFLDGEEQRYVSVWRAGDTFHRFTAPKGVAL